MQQAQTAALLSLLNLNNPVEAQNETSKSGSGFKTPPPSGPPVWKILVLDQHTKDVLATVLRVQDLRDVGVTLHVCVSSSCLPATFSERICRQLHSRRPPLQDVPAVYFVSPTLANITRIAEDLEKSLYESFHLNFVEPLPRALLEELASSVAQSGSGELVGQVLDQYLSFIAPSPSLFSLLPQLQASVIATAPPKAIPPSTYAILNSPSSTDQQIEEEIERVASGLFSAVATMGMRCCSDYTNLTIPTGHVPIIRAPKGNAAEMVAKKLETKIRDSLISSSRSHGSSLFSQDATGLSNLQRPRTWPAFYLFSLFRKL